MKPPPVNTAPAAEPPHADTSPAPVAVENELDLKLEETRKLFDKCVTSAHNFNRFQWISKLLELYPRRDGETHLQIVDRVLKGTVLEDKTLQKARSKPADHSVYRKEMNALLRVSQQQI